MSSPITYEAGLGTAGILNGSGKGAVGTIACDAGRGWQSCGVVTSADTAIVDVNDVPGTRVCTLPPDGQNVAIRALANGNSGTVTAKIYGFPYDPGTGTKAEQNQSDGNAAGELIGALTFTMTASTADSPSTAATADRFISDTQVVDRRGYHFLVGYITAVTTLTIGQGVELVYRTF